jgi:hypothetical protein
MLKSSICNSNSYNFIHKSKYRDGFGVCHCYNCEYSSCYKCWHFVIHKLVASMRGVSCIKVTITAFVRYGVQTILILGMSLRVSSMMSEATKCTCPHKAKHPPGEASRRVFWISFLIRRNGSLCFRGSGEAVLHHSCRLQGSL